MENSNIKISIPTPCHEDWNKMTPNEKGAFCGKCCKTVVDFSNLSPEEIKSALIAEKGKKVCGRFKPDQLNEQPTPALSIHIPLYLLPKNISLRKAFAIALFVAFGTSLFSCRTTEDHLVGEIAVETIPLNDSTLIKTKESTDTTLRIGNSNTDPVIGTIQVNTGDERIQPVTNIKTDPDPEPIKPKMGKIKIEKQE